MPTDPLPDDIVEPRTQRWARLADIRYALLLGFVEHYLLVAGGDRRILMAWIFAEMRSRLGPIARRLTTLPRGEGVGAAPFTPVSYTHLTLPTIYSV